MMVSGRSLWAPLLALLASGLLGLAAGCGDPPVPPGNADPVAQIISHRDRDPEREGFPVDVVGSVSDTEDEALALTVRWLLDDLEVCGPMPPEPTGITSCTLNLPAPGDARVILEVSDRDGGIGRAAVWLYGVATAAPVAVIQRPLPDQVFAPGEPVDLVGNVADAEDAATALTVSWESDLQGPLPALAGPDAGGGVTGRTTLQAGRHRITLRVVDTTEKSATATVDIQVLEANQPPTCSLTTPLTGGVGRASDGVLVTAVVGDANDGAATLQVTVSSDLEGTLGTPAPTTAGDVSLNVPALAGGTHTLRLEARDPAGATCSDQALYTATLPPTVQILAPAVGSYVPGTALDLDAQVADDRDAPGSLVLSWTSDLDGALGTPTADAAGFARLPAVVLAALGTHHLVLSVTDSDGQQALASLDLTIAVAPDDPPSSPTIHLQPVPTHDGDELSVVLDAPGVDPEGQAVTHRTAWTIDGAPSTETGATIAAGLTAVGEVWEVSVFASDGALESPPATAQTTIVADGLGPPGCSLPATYGRVIHLQGAVDLQRVAWAPDGSYALILGYPTGLFRYEPTTGELTLVDAGAGEAWRALTFDAGGGFALVGGDDAGNPFAPLLYRYDDGLGLTAIAGITGIATGGLVASSRIVDLVQRPGADVFTVLVDNGPSANPGITYLHEVVFDWAGGAHAWTYHGGLNTSQGASSIDWGTKLGQPTAVAVSRYIDVMQFEPLLATGNFHLEAAPNHGNTKRVIFDPVDRAVAWVLQWSGSGRVYPWEDQLLGATESFGFSGYSMWDFAVREDGSWKVFVGRNGNIWFTDSAFRPIDGAAFVNQPLPNFDQPPWSGSTSDYLQGAAFRPGTCEGLIVGDATAGQGLLVDFALIEN